jgi:hypothetical protein
LRDEQRHELPVKELNIRFRAVFEEENTMAHWQRDLVPCRVSARALVRTEETKD